jgi:type IV pilus assembly protein PilM
MAVSKVLCIELGDTTKIAEVDYKKENPKIYKTAIFDLKDTQLGARGDVGVDEDGMIRGRETVARILQDKLSELKFNNKNVVFSILSTKVLTRDAMLPLAKAATIQNMVQTQAGQYFPVDVNEYEYSYSIINKTEDKQLHVMVYAISKQLVKSYVKLAENAGLNLVALEYGGNAQFQLFLKNQAEPDEATVYIDINANNSIISIVHDKKLESQRIISYGVNQIVDRIKDYKTYATTSSWHIFEMLKNEEYVRGHFDDEDAALRIEEETEDLSDEETVAMLEKLEIKDAIVDDLRAFVGSVYRLIETYKQKNRELKIAKKAYFFGKGSLVKGIINLLTNELKLDFVIFDEVPGVSFPKDLSEDEIVRMMSVVGAGINPIGFEILTDEKESAAERMNARMGKFYAMLAVSVIATGAMIAYGYYKYSVQQQKNTKYQNELEKLTVEIGDKYQRYVASENAVENARAFNNGTYEYTINFNELLRDLEKNVPSDTVISSLSWSKNKVTLNVTTASKITTSQLLAQVEAISVVKYVNIASVAETIDEEVVPPSKEEQFTLEITLEDPVFDDGSTITNEEVEPNGLNGYAKDLP